MTPIHHAHNIIFVLPAGLTVSGVTTWSINMGRQLIQRGYPVGLIQHASFGPQLDIPLPPEVQLVRCQNQATPDKFYSEADVADYLSDYKRLMPGLIIPSGGSGTYATCALMTKRQPEILRVLGFAHADEDVYYDWLSYYEPIIAKFVGSSREIGIKLRQLLPHRRQDIVVRPYAVEVSPTLDRTYSSPVDPLQLIYVGRMIEYQKRVSDLFRLVQALEVAQVNFHLRLVGDGPDAKSLLEALQNTKAYTQRRVTWINTLPPAQMPPVWRTTDICILVSEYEGTSVSMLEGMAQGCVPVVTQVSGAAEAIRAGDNGFLAPVGHIGEMAQVIKSLDQDRQRLASLGAAAHATVLENFAYDAYVPWFLDLVKQAWQQPSRPWPAGRPLHARPTIKELVEQLSGEELSRIVSLPKLIKATGFKVAARPGLRWLYRFRDQAKLLLHKIGGK